MSLNADKARLAGVTREISLRWLETKEHWRDEKCREFEQKYMAELFANVDKAIMVMGKLDEILNKVRKDCE